MTTYQLLRANESLLRIFADNKINIADVAYLEIYAQFEKMKRAGHKVGYITVYLGDKYGMSERGIYKVIKRFNKIVDLGSII